MSSAAAARAKGVAWENEVARYVGGQRQRVFHPDIGDVAGLKDVVVEAKAQGRLELAAWQRQLRDQVDRVQAQLGLLAVKTRGKQSAEDGLWIVDPRSVPFIVELVQKEWYGSRGTTRVVSFSPLD